MTVKIEEFKTMTICEEIAELRFEDSQIRGETSGVGKEKRLKSRDVGRGFDTNMT